MTATGFRAEYPFASRYHDLGGVRMHYVEEGAGPAVVMVHGNPTWSFFWRRLLLELRGTHRAIAPDHVGMGLSDKPQDHPYTLATHIDNLDRLLAARLEPGEKVSLIVHDWGGAIGLGWAARHPERIAKLVICNTAAFLGGRVPLRIALCRLPGFGPLAVRGANAFVAGALRMAVARPLSAAAREGFLAPYGSWADRIGVLRFVQDIPTGPHIPSYAVLQEIEAALPRFAKTPALLQWGARDWCFTPLFFAEWRRRLPGAEADLYADAGHYLLEDAGERIVPRVRTFLAASAGGCA